MAFLTRQQILAARDCGPDDLSGLDFDHLDARWDGMTVEEQAAARANSPGKVDTFLAHRPKSRHTMEEALNVAALYEATQDQLAGSARECRARMQAPLNVAALYEATQDQLARSAREYLARIETLPSLVDRHKAVQDQLAISAGALAQWIGGISIEVKAWRAQALGAAIFSAIKNADAQMLRDLVSDEDFGDEAMRVASAWARGDVQAAQKELQAAKEMARELAGRASRGGRAKAAKTLQKKEAAIQRWKEFTAVETPEKKLPTKTAFYEETARELDVRPQTVERWIREFRRANAA